MKYLLVVLGIIFSISSCSEKANEWSAKDQKDFKESCVANARNGIGEEKAILYCNCMLGKVMKKYPDINDSEKMTMGETMELANECAKEPGLAPTTPATENTGTTDKKE